MRHNFPPTDRLPIWKKTGFDCQIFDMFFFFKIKLNKFLKVVATSVYWSLVQRGCIKELKECVNIITYLHRPLNARSGYELFKYRYKQNGLYVLYCTLKSERQEMYKTYSKLKFFLLQFKSWTQFNNLYPSTYFIIRGCYKINNRWKRK